MTSLVVCDTCRLRKVKCDRDDPCGNCVDSNIQCNRTSPAARSASKRRRGAESTTTPPNVQRAIGHQTHLDPSSPRSASVPQSPSLIEAHDFIRQEIASGKSMPADRLAVLNSAMSFVTHLGQSVNNESLTPTRTPRVVNILEDIDAPSVELLYWMLRELKGGSLGTYVLDFFKHVSPKSLKAMGLALINRTGDAETLLLYSICVNSAVYKFIITVLSEAAIGSIEEGLRENASRYLESVKLAMTRIYLLAAPSLLFLQSLLCSAFIAQGQGDSVHCWAFISAACKTCEDLNLEAQINACQTETEDAIELYYCYVWCHILDKNYSMMLGRTRCLLNHDGLDAVFSSPLNRSLSTLLSTYLLFVPVQAIFILELHPAKISNRKSSLSRVEFMVIDLLERLKGVYARIAELHGPSDSWSGLHMGTELTTVHYSYHSLRTSILRSKQICSPAQSYVDHDCLDSARMAMSTLRGIQEAALALNDVRERAAYMHWTLLYHPLMPFFVLVCNIVATSDPHDFQTLKHVTEELDGLVHLSSSIAKLQTLFKSFVDLCEGLVSEKRQKTFSTSPFSTSHGENFEVSPNYQVPSSSRTPFQTGINDFAPAATNAPLPPPPSTSTLFMTQDADFTYRSDGIPSVIGPGWELLDAQPALDWLDADFSFLGGGQ